LDVPSLARRADESGSIPLPSWVLDWSTTDFAESVRIRPEGEGVLPQHEATPFHLDASVDFTGAGNLLRLSRYVFDKIAELGHLNEPYIEITWAKNIAHMPAYHCIFSSVRQSRAAGLRPLLGRVSRSAFLVAVGSVSADAFPGEYISCTLTTPRLNGGVGTPSASVE
jgi:hypothetical protein